MDNTWKSPHEDITHSHTGVINNKDINDARHEKTDLKDFVVVIPKKGWVF